MRSATRSNEDTTRALDAYDDPDEAWTYLYDPPPPPVNGSPSRTFTAGTGNKTKIPLDRWMAYLPDRARLSMLSLPGTHNSCARIPVPWVQCQSATLTAQLHMGIRYFDFRLGVTFGVMRVYHGGTPLSVTFADAVRELYDFLGDRSSEALVLQVKHEGSDRNDRLFERLFREEVEAHGEMWRVGSAIPRLGYVRGKIQLMRRFRLVEDPRATTLGIDVLKWADNAARFWIPVPPRPSHLMVQDEYRFTHVVSTFEELIKLKTKAIADLMQEARFTDTEFRRHGWYLNWCNAFAEPFSLKISATPEQIALGRGGETGVNEIVRRTIEKARSEGEQVRVGTILLDFVDVDNPAVVQEVVMCNDFLDIDHQA